MKGKGKGSITPKGYRIVNVLDSDGTVRILPEHRHVMEQHLGRRLERQEVVHHINHDRSDNRLSNLELLASHGEHIKSHHPPRRGRVLGDRWSRRWAACLVCGRSDSQHRGKGVCGRCMEAARRASQPKGVCSACDVREVRYGGTGVCRSCAMRASRARQAAVTSR